MVLSLPAATAASIIHQGFWNWHRFWRSLHCRTTGCNMLGQPVAECITRRSLFPRDSASVQINVTACHKLPSSGVWVRVMTSGWQTLTVERKIWICSNDGILFLHLRAEPKPLCGSGERSNDPALTWSAAAGAARLCNRWCWAGAPPLYSLKCTWTWNQTLMIRTPPIETEKNCEVSWLKQNPT